MVALMHNIAKMLPNRTDMGNGAVYLRHCGSNSQWGQAASFFHRQAEYVLVALETLAKVAETSAKEKHAHTA